MLLLPHVSLGEGAPGHDNRDGAKADRSSMGVPIPSNEITAPVNRSLPLIETEVVCFLLKGKRSWHELNLYDLGSVTTPEGDHLIPLLRLVKALDFKWSEEQKKLRIKPAGGQETILDLEGNKLVKGESSRPVRCVEGISDISQERDIFLPAGIVAEILAMEITWDDAIYGFSARTEQPLSIWQVENGKSAFAIKTEAIPINLPEPLPPATPCPDLLGLDFIGLRGRLNYSAVDPYSERMVVLDSLEQTFWGGLANGRYKLTFSEPAIFWNDPRHKGVQVDPPYLKLQWGELKYQLPLAQIVVGDSVFGLNSLTFPSVATSGVRVNGLFGLNGGLTRKDSSGLGLYNNFIIPTIFRGQARVGSEVQLFVNDRLVGRHEVLISLPGEPGIGAYNFEEVSLAPASLNNVRIVIKDPDGVETVVERNVMGTSTSLPKGSLAVLGGAGTNRNPEWAARGLFAGGRILYGLSDFLTLGATAAIQQSFFKEASLDSQNIDERQYPGSSWHAGAQFTLKPVDFSLVSGDFSWSSSKQDEGVNEYAGLAYKVGWELYPLKNTTLSAEYFHYDQDFFNGLNRNLQDRQGYFVNGSFHLAPNLTLNGAYGHVNDNTAKSRKDTRGVELQNLELGIRSIPQTSLLLSYNRLAPNWEKDDKQLLAVSIQSRFLPGWYLNSSYSTGDDLVLNNNRNFFEGLRLQGFTLLQSRNTMVTLSRALPDGHNLQLYYWKAGVRERVSVIHTASRFGDLSLVMRTEIGQSLDTETLFFENRTEIPLSASGGTRFQIQARYEQEEWRVGVSFNFVELFHGIDGLFARVKKERINPDQGHIAGRVFVDVNANAKLDPGEPGIDNMKVLLDGRREAYTTATGYFALPQPVNASEAKLSLDPNEILAIYASTNGQQRAYITPGEKTEINLGITPVHTVTGQIVSKDLAGKVNPLSGIRVCVAKEEGTDNDINSITASDGSYYLQDIRPGRYRIYLDPKTIPSDYSPRYTPHSFEISPSKDPQNLEIPSIELLHKANGSFPLG